MEVYIRLTDLPVTIPGFSAADENGDYNIYLNARLSADQQEKALLHEMQHVLCDDLYNDKSIEEVERNAEMHSLP